MFFIQVCYGIKRSHAVWKAVEGVRVGRRSDRWLGVDFIQLSGDHDELLEVVTRLKEARIPYGVLHIVERPLAHLSESEGSVRWVLERRYRHESQAAREDCVR